MSEIRKPWAEISDESGFLMFWPETDDNFMFIQTSSSSAELIHCKYKVLCQHTDIRTKKP